MEPPAASTPLEGLLVADFSRVLAGPLASMVLGDLGAEVIKVERPGKGDATRSYGPPFHESGMSTYYLSVNRNKRSITLNLSVADDRRRAITLARRADVLIENFRPGVMERFGLGYADLSRSNSGLVYCSIRGFGQASAPFLPGYDFLAQAMTGLMSLTGAPEGNPTKVGVPVVDYVTGLHAVVGILSALGIRRETGRGQNVSVDLFTSGMAMLTNQASAYLNAGVRPSRLGNLHPSITPYEAYETGTTPIVVAVGSDTQYRSLCEVLGKPELAIDKRFATNRDRVASRGELQQLLQDALLARPRDAWIERLRARAVPCGPVNDLEGAFAFARSAGIDLIAEHTVASGSLRSVRFPVSLSDAPLTSRRPPPDLGQHNAEVLTWLDDASEEP